MWKVPWTFSFWLVLNGIELMLVSGGVYPEPSSSSTTQYCHPLVSNGNIPDVTAAPYAFTTVSVPDTIFTGSRYALTILLETGASKCFFHYFAKERKLLLLPDPSVLSQHSTRNLWFQVTGKSVCSQSTGTSRLSVKLSRSYQTICWKINFLVQSGTFISCEVVDLEKIVTKISKYLGKSLSDVLILDYEKVPARNNQLKFTLSLSSHVVDCTKCGEHYLRHFTSKFVSPDGTINQILSDLLLPKYLIIYAHSETDCSGGGHTPSLPTTSSSTTTTLTQRIPSTTTTTTTTRRIPSTTTTTTTRRIPSTTTTTTTTRRIPSTTTTTTTQCVQPTVVNPITSINVPLYTPHTVVIPNTIFNSNAFHFTLRPQRPKITCWYQLRHNKIDFFATDDILRSYATNRIPLTLTARSFCGLSTSLTFYVNLQKPLYSNCLLTSMIIKRTETEKCNSEIMREYFTKIQNYLPRDVKIFFVINWKVLSFDTLKITLALSPHICTTCNKQYVDRYQRHFVQTNGDVSKAFAQHMSPTFNILHINFILAGKCKTDNPCYPPVLEKSIPFIYLQPGVINTYNIPNSTFSHSQTFQLSLRKTPTHQICWVELRQRQTLLLLPSYEEASYNLVQKYQLGVVATETVCSKSTEQNVNLIVQKIKHAPCFHVKLTFATTKIYPCMVEPVQKFVKVLTKYLQVKEQDVKILSYSASTTQQNLIDVYLTLSNNVMPCSIATLSRLQAYMNILVNSRGVINAVLLKFIGKEYTIQSANYSLLPSHKVRVLFRNSSDSFIPLWLYMLPMLIILAVIILILLLCCCCRSLHRCCTGCCFNVCAKSSYNVTSYQSHNNYDFKGGSTQKTSRHIHSNNEQSSHVESHLCATDDLYKAGTSTSVNVLAMDHVNGSKHKGITNKSFEGDQHIHAENDCDTKVVHLESYSDARKSKRGRSYSEGDLLSHRLNLPKIPAVGCSTLHSKRNTAALPSWASDDVFNSYVDGCCRQKHRKTSTLPVIIKTTKQTVPVKISARVNNVSSELDLNSFRPSHIHVERKRTPDVLLFQATPRTRISGETATKKSGPVVFMENKRGSSDDDDIEFFRNKKRRKHTAFHRKFSSKDDDALASRRKRFIRLSNERWMQSEV